MKFSCAASVIAFWTFGFESSATYWDCDDRCPNYDDCMDGGARRHVLEQNLVIDDEDASSRKDERLYQSSEDAKSLVPAADKNINVAEPASLRRGTGNQQRQLKETYFHLKMYHEESKDYCWQGEWEDRRWCLDCEGSECNHGDDIEIRTCERQGQRDQQFVYEPVSGSDGGRIKPYFNQDLCLVRLSSSQEFGLDWCEEDGYDDKEIFLGFTFDSEFKLVPKTLRDNCLTQNHYPRNGERIYATDCDEACHDATCLWETIYIANKSDENGNLPPIQDNGDGYCTEDEPCEQCSGDCDTDYECTGDLICCKRGRYDKVPTCSGGEDNDSSKHLWFEHVQLFQMCFLRLFSCYSCIHSFHRARLLCSSRIRR